MKGDKPAKGKGLGVVMSHNIYHIMAHPLLLQELYWQQKILYVEHTT